MRSSNEISKEIEKELKSNPQRDPFLTVRKKYLDRFKKKRKRNVIAYYSGWLQKPPPTGSGHLWGSEINDRDKNAFMTVIHGLKREEGLDLILHTQGGEIAATESLVYYLKTMFQNDIEVFVPQIAMSAGTMIACASKVIHMGKQSNLGPIDPQVSGGISAPAIVEEFNRASEEVKRDPSKLPFWQIIVNKYHPTLILSCENAVEWSKEIVEKWLNDSMYTGNKKEDKELCKKIVAALSDHKRMKTHSRHINIEEAKDIGLNICELEKNQPLQDIVLSVHHAYICTLSFSKIFKIVENHNGIGQAMHIG